VPPTAMTQKIPGKGQLQAEAAAAARETRPWIAGLARFGQLAHGVVYGVVGYLAARAAAGTGGTTTDTNGALGWVVQAPFGKVLLVVLAVGLVGYAMYRLVQAGWDTENKGSDFNGLRARGAYAFIGLVHIGLALSATGLAAGRGGGSGSDDTTRDLTARLLAAPLGQFLVAAVGLGVLGVAGFQLYAAWTARFRRRLDLGGLGPSGEHWVVRLGQAGYAARGVIFAIIGLFLILAGLRAEPGEARGLGGALAALAEQPFGPYLLGIVAAGFVAYGTYAGLEARYRRITLP
jgi:hypothetical protein